MRKIMDPDHPVKSKDGPLDFQIIAIDEAQDMKPLLYRLMCKARALPRFSLSRCIRPV